MFQLETEDMLPRMAPKPSSDVPSGETEGIIRPQVPEVSILFGQQEAALKQPAYKPASQQQQQNKQTYADWKKHILPKVTFPSRANVQFQGDNVMINDYNSARTTVYANRLNNNPASNMNTNAFGGGNGNVPLDSQITYRRSLESCNNNPYQQVHNMPALNTQTTLGAMQPTKSHLPNKTYGEVLTICAGTQTDTNLESQHVQPGSWSNLASKQDVEELKQMLDDLKFEQQRISKILESILLSHLSQMPAKTQCRDISIQVDFKDNDAPCINNDKDSSGQDEQPILKNKFLQHLKPTNNILQSPKCKPVAQSTTYRPPSPKLINRDFLQTVPSPIYQQQFNKPTPLIHKSASDTSLAMNELALKYLPNEKLAELLKELNMDCALDGMATNASTTGTANMERANTDISNASYKYLKKYRLLPEDREENGKSIASNMYDGAVDKGNENQMQCNSPQYHIRNTPLNQRPTPLKRCSPYADQLPLSPLAIPSSPSLQSAAPQHIVYLENIKHQPKFI